MRSRAAAPTLVDDETAADRVDRSPRTVPRRPSSKARKRHAVGVERQGLAAMHDQILLFVEADRSCSPSRFNSTLRRGSSARRASTLSVSTDSGSSPSRPSITALSLPWPLPVAPSEPYRSVLTRATRDEQPCSRADGWQTAAPRASARPCASWTARCRLKTGRRR